jgi:TetR/AcrR family transcriptional repressor of nem operon
MRVDRPTVVSHRAAILDAAGRLFRRHGIAAVPVAEVTREAGLTHGAFYGHFASKDALAAESCRTSLEEAAERWAARAERARAFGREPIGALIDAYLTERHRDSPEEGCALAALGPEIARAGAPLADALGAGVAALAVVLEQEIARRDPTMAEPDRTRTALAILATLTGGIVLARACRANPVRSHAALDGAARLARQAVGLTPEPLLP